MQPKPKRNAILGLALGIVLGLGFAFLWEALDTRVRRAEEIGDRLGVNESRVSQIHKPALERMAAALRSFGIASRSSILLR